MPKTIENISYTFIGNRIWGFVLLYLERADFKMFVIGSYFLDYVFLYISSVECITVAAQVLYNRLEAVPPARSIKLARFCLSFCLRWPSDRATYVLELGGRYVLCPNP